MKKVVLNVSIPPREVLDRLEKAVDRWSFMILRFLWLPVRKGFVGRIGKKRFAIRKERYYVNSLAPLMSGRVTSTRDGSRIDARIGISVFWKWFLVWWFGGVVFLGVIFIAIAGKALFSGEAEPSDWFGFCVVVLMLVFGGVFVKICRTFGKPEEKELAEFIYGLFGDCSTAEDNRH